MTGKEVEQVEDRWPVVRIHRDKNASEGFGYMLTQPGAPASLPTEGDPSFVSSDYYPASHPAVLSKDEARLLAHHLPPSTTGSDGKEICSRLSAWTEGGS